MIYSIIIKKRQGNIILLNIHIYIMQVLLCISESAYLVDKGMLYHIDILYCNI